MKTPMQILMSEIEDGLKQDEIKVSPKELLQHLTLRCRGLLEKEKEVMCEFAFNCGDEIKDQNNWRSPRNLTNYEVILDFYNETFKTKEK